ncbi:MAG: hypothetical protein Q8T08_23995 [Ignavibacteria bacterium]|nr:hypothetical protein [Ignavibacteria bacterium]
MVKKTIAPFLYHKICHAMTQNAQGPLVKNELSKVLAPIYLTNLKPELPVNFNVDLTK